MNMLKSFKTPVTLPTVVTSYYEPKPSNGLSLVGRNRAAHQMFLSHQTRLINTILGSIKGHDNKRSIEIARQNKLLEASDFLHLCSIADRLLSADLVNESTYFKLIEELEVVFYTLFPDSIPIGVSSATI
jgi:hypothetical protein